MDICLFLCCSRVCIYQYRSTAGKSFFYSDGWITAIHQSSSSSYPSELVHGPADDSSRPPRPDTPNTYSCGIDLQLLIMKGKSIRKLLFQIMVLEELNLLQIVASSPEYPNEASVVAPIDRCESRVRHDADEYPIKHWMQRGDIPPATCSYQIIIPISWRPGACARANQS
jgi:hypothetical protein